MAENTRSSHRSGKLHAQVYAQVHRPREGSGQRNVRRTVAAQSVRISLAPSQQR
jgi:hypothetical protein